MLLDGFKYLRAHHVFTKPAHFLTKLKEPSLVEFEIFGGRRAVDILHDIAFAICLPLAGFHE